MNTEEKNHALRLLVRGAGITLVGIVLLDFFAFFYKLIIARYLGPVAYGQLTISITVLCLLTAFAMMGMPAGMGRFISYYLGQKRVGETKAVMFAGLLVVLPVSLLFAITVYFTAPWIALRFFHSQDSINLIRIFGWIIPLYALVQLGKSILQGFKRIGHRVLVESFGEQGVRLALTTIAVIAGRTVYDLAIAYLVGMAIALLIAMYLISKAMKKVQHAVTFPLGPVTKELLIFSLPLAFSSIVFSVMKWSDTLMLGYFKDAALVGLYNVALPLSFILSLSYSAFRNLTLPVMSEFHAKHKAEELRASFLSISRWIFLTTFPAFLLIILFPREIITIFFGSQYRTAALPLVILSFGVFINAITGLVAETLQTYAKTRYIFWVACFGTVLNVGLNYLLIPRWGMAGAAIATSIAISMVNLIMLYWVHQLLHLTFEYRYYLKYLASSIIPFTILYVVLDHYRPLSIFMAALGLVVFLCLNTLLLFLLRSFSPEDVMIMATIENRFKLPLGWLRRRMQ